MDERPATLAAWHAIVATKDPSGIPALLDDNVVFRSPAVHTPQLGPALTTAYLTAAVHVLGPTVRYTDEWVTPTSAVLEFEADLDGVAVHGIDMIRWNDAGKITEFTVMTRPFKGLQELITRMGAELAKLRGA